MANISTGRAKFLLVENDFAFSLLNYRKTFDDIMIHFILLSLKFKENAGIYYSCVTGQRRQCSK